jgi:hypothetical protein
MGTAADERWVLVEEVLAIQRIALGRTEAGVADDAAQLFFAGAWCAPAFRPCVTQDDWMFSMLSR